MVAFNDIPSQLRIPFFATEFNNQGAFQGPALQPYRHVFIGPKLSSGSKDQNTMHLVSSYEQAKDFFGAGSILALMVDYFKKENKIHELHCIGVDDDQAGVKAEGSLEITGTATAAGSLAFYIAGKRVVVGVDVGDTGADVVSSLVTAIQANSDLLTSAAIDGVNTDLMNVTAKNAGEIGNSIDLRTLYRREDNIPAGLVATVTAMSGGATNADIQAAIDVVDDSQYIFMTNAFYDSGNIGKLETELTNRFQPLPQIDGYALYEKQGTLSELVTEGGNYNNVVTSIGHAVGPAFPSCRVAAKVGVISQAAQIDPARPFQTLEVRSIEAPLDTEVLKDEDRNTLLFNGIYTDKLNAAGFVQIERQITTYQTNAAGAADISYLDLNTPLTLSYLRYDWNNYMASKYPRHKLGDDGKRYNASQPIMTPKLGRSEAITKFKQWERAALVENLTQFKEDLIVERSEADPNRLEFLLPPDLINQLRVLGTQIAFLL